MRSISTKNHFDFWNIILIPLFKACIKMAKFTLWLVTCHSHNTSPLQKAKKTKSESIEWWTLTTLKGAILGQNLFVVTFLSLIMFYMIDWFSRWYPTYLDRFYRSAIFKRNLLRIWWAILAALFWFALLRKSMPDEFSITHFSFALFIFSLYRLLKSLIGKKPTPEET